MIVINGPGIFSIFLKETTKQKKIYILQKCLEKCNVSPQTYRLDIYIGSSGSTTAKTK